MCSQWRPAFADDTSKLPCVVYLHGNSSARIDVVKTRSLSVGGGLLDFLRFCLLACLFAFRVASFACGWVAGVFSLCLMIACRPFFAVSYLCLCMCCVCPQCTLLVFIGVECSLVKWVCGVTVGVLKKEKETIEIKQLQPTVLP